MIHILCIGDVVGTGGLKCLSLHRAALRARYDPDLIVVNGENSAEGNGMTRASAAELVRAGADVVTGGNHTFKWRESYALLDDGAPFLRPANYPASAPGVGYAVFDAKGYRVLVMNLLGTVYMEPLTSPIDCAARILETEAGRYDLALCDFHGEATSEKLCFARYFDGKISAVFGTHTHVQTADAQILPGGTGYITDAGMCGSHGGILGVRTEDVVKKFTTCLPVKFTPAEGELRLCGVFFALDPSSGRCVRAESVSVGE